MSFQVNLNSVDISARIVSGPIVHKNDVLHGKISPNECSFDIDNTNLAYTIANLDIEGQLVEVWVDSVKQFTGYAEKPTLTRNGRTVHVQAFDKMKQLQKLKCQDKMFIGSTADDILTWLVETCGGIGSGSHNLDSIVVASGVGTTQAVVGYALYSIKDKLTDKLQEIVDSVGGTMWFDESGVLQFRAGFAATWSTSTEGTITVSKLKDIDSLQWLPSEGDRVIVKSKNRSVKTEKEPIFTWAGTVTSDGLPTGKDENGNAITDDQWRAKFDSPAIDVDDYATVDAAKEFDSGLTLNQTVYDANFDTGVLKYPDFMYLQIDNSSGVDKNVTKLVIEGKPVVENYLEVIYDAGSFNTEREVSNDLISSKVWASSLAKWLYENGNDKFEAVVPLADFSLGLGWSVGDKVEIVDASTGLSHRAWVRAIDIDYRNRDLTVTLRSDRDSEFEYTPPPGSITGPGTNIPYDPQFGDGSAPATPTGLALSTFFSDGKTYVKATWSANTETDIKGYEVAWSYDGVNWYNSGLTSETSLVIEVKAGVTVYVKVKAKDIEGFESAWCTATSITSAKDTTIPADATAITASGGFDIIYIYWNHSKPSDFSHYVVERAPSPYSSWVEIAVVQSKEFIDKNVVAGTYYKYRVKAYDIYGNSSTSWVTTSTGVTCSSISSELSDLDTRLTNLDFSDIAGYIAGGQITDDTIIARMILAGEIKTLHMDVDEIVGNSAWFGKIVANHIATDAVTANKILAGSVTANKLEATLDLSVGRKITVGSNVQIGKAVGPTGLTGDGIYVSKDAYFRINSGLFMDEGLWMGKSLGERIHPFMTSNTTPSGYEVSNNDGDTYAWYLFRESTSTPISHYVNHWSQIKLPVRKVLKTYNIFSYSSSNCASGWKIQGSNDGTNWTDLDTQSGVLAWSGWLLSDVSISSPGAYLYYRLLITAVTGSYASISSIKLFDAEGWKFSVVASGSDPNFLAWDGQLNLKGNLILGSGENAIYFEDGLINMIDRGYASSQGLVAMQWSPTEKDFVTFAYGNYSAEHVGYLMVESDFYNGAVREGRTWLQFETHSNSGSENDYIRLWWQAGDTRKFWYYYESGSFTINGFVKFNEYIKFGIPTWYGTKTTATNKYPNWTDWTDAEDCPNSNIWIWLKSSGTPNYVLYVKSPHDSSTYSYWVALNRVTL